MLLFFFGGIQQKNLRILRFKDGKQNNDDEPRGRKIEEIFEKYQFRSDYKSKNYLKVRLL